jgi:hypothetical protein
MSHRLQLLLSELRRVAVSVSRVVPNVFRLAGTALRGVFDRAIFPMRLVTGALHNVAVGASRNFAARRFVVVPRLIEMAAQPRSSSPTSLIRAASPRSWKLSFWKISFLTLPCPFNRCSNVRLGPMRCSRTIGSTTGCFRPINTRGLEPLLATLAEQVIAPAEAKVKALEERRRMIEAELTKASP